MQQEWSASETKFYQQIYDLRPWYHDFARLGLQTVFEQPSTLGGRVVRGLRRLLGAARRGMRGDAVEKGQKFSLRHIFSAGPSPHLFNQRHKEHVIVPFLQDALQRLGDAPSCLDLFCADGYYSCLVAHLCPDATITGVDLDSKEIERAQTAARLLRVRQARFVLADVGEFVRRSESFDLVLCTGGLYHLREPRRFLEALYPVCAGLTVIQSVVTLETESPDFFISPAPGWKHGSRFTHAGLRGWLEKIGWQVLRESRNELTGNARLCDRGSSYFLCQSARSTSKPE